MKTLSPQSILALIPALGMLLSQCHPPNSSVETNPDIQVAHLSEGDKSGLAAIRHAFVASNPGYDLDYLEQVQTISARSVERVLFVQEGGGTASVSDGDSSKFSIGDIIILKSEETLETDSLASFLIFSVPEPAPERIPKFIRPDWDDQITDTPGGCATETNAYRRILLTWLSKVGPYQWHAINAHRVRIMDSFSHYHPKDIGFDEFYLVQMAQAKAKIITSNQVALIENPNGVTKEQAQELLKTTALKVGDLVYLPRGVMHRGLDGVLAQVITVPGFVPGSEIGVDHHLRVINQRLQLREKEKLPLNEEASHKVVIK